MPIDIERAERAVQDLLASFGLEQGSPELKDTPAKVADFWAERLDGYSFDPAAEFQPILQDIDPCPIFLERVPFASICEHHLTPFSGHVNLGYVPGDAGAVGLSKLIRLVQAFANRLQMQERMTWQIFNAMETHLRPKGWGVRVVAEHTCIAHRGVKISNVPITTILMGGEWQLDPPSAFR
jgi:GTP cyclohydrolase I